MELENKIKALIEKNDRNNFIYDFLALYDFSKARLTILKKDPSKLSQKENQIIIKNKLFYEYYNDEETLFKLEKGNLLERIHTLNKEDATHKHSPRFIIVTDFEQFLAIDTKTQDTLDVSFADVWKHTDFFLPWTGKEKYQTHIENPADVRAAEKMAKIYDEITHHNKGFSDEYNHDLNVFLTRLLFCFFAEDTGIFADENLFTKALVEHTKEDGSDLKQFFETLFKALDKIDKTSFPTYMQKFPYVNGHLFRDETKIPEMTAKVRELMIECGDRNNWKEINPDIFGSMFQAVKTAEVRAGLGQHYTSVPNIMKVINPLFMDEFREEFEKNIDNEKKLKELWSRLTKIRIFDPACGSGNFLIIAFKQMKLLEMDIIKRINVLQKQNNFQMNLSRIELKQFYGIEIDDFACEIAKLSLWLAEHQMNCKFREEIGEPRPTLPLSESGHIVCGNACRLDWEKVCPKYIEKTTLAQEVDRTDLQNTPLKLDLPKEEAEVYILGNPPFDGAKKQNAEQKNDIKYLFEFTKTYKNLDYVSCWFLMAKRYIENNKMAQFAFVATNSITQGLHISLLWPYILNEKTEIVFAYQSFKWNNNAKHNAGVTCVIIGIANKSNDTKFLYQDGRKIISKNITPYLRSEDSHIQIKKSRKPISNFPIMEYGNMPLEGNFLKLTPLEKEKIVEKTPGAEKYIRPLIGGEEFLKGKKRYCIWIDDEDLPDARSYSEIADRIEKVRNFRINAGEVAKTLVNRSHQFRYRKEAKKAYVILPCTSSERRNYIPCGFIGANYISLNSAQAIYDAEPWIFGVVTSLMHMVWVRAVGGKLETRIRYSAELCYNTFPFPKISEQQKKRIELCVQDILRVRESYSEKTMAELYDPDKMPKDLLDAHHSLDLVIEACYRKKPFENDEQRLAHLFKMYEMMTNNASEEELKQLELGV